MTHNILGNTEPITSIRAAAALYRGRGVTADGYLYNGSSHILGPVGIALEDAAILTGCSLQNIGRAVCESGALITAGQELGFDSVGRVTPTASALTTYVIGTAIGAASAAGEEILVEIRPYNYVDPTGVDGTSMVYTAIATFDPSATAGMRTIAAHTLGVTIPDNAIIIDGRIDVLTTFTSATDAGTIAIHVQSANDIRTATAISTGTSWDAPTIQATVPVGTVATAIKLTAAREITATVAVEALTAGKCKIYLDYVLGI
jgi:hypothetical protein